MKITTKIHLLTCPGFGHQHKHTVKSAKKSHILSCATCQSMEVDNDLEPLEMYPFRNQEIRTALQELFILQSQYYRKHSSV